MLAENDQIPDSLISDRVTAAAFLESIALFELLGTKWMLAVVFAKWTEQIHAHAADEVRHTKIVQDAAKQLRWELSDQELIRERKIQKEFYFATEDYLSRLSKKIFRLTVSHGQDSDKFAISAYSLLAFLIERRIMKIYPVFAKHGPTVAIREMAQNLIADERSHLKMVTERLPAGLASAFSTQEEIIEIEAELATEWLRRIVRVANSH